MDRQSPKSEQYQVIALICCRGGSKGIPGKNIKDFAGKPLLCWILEAAQKAKVFNQVILSTDSQQIAQVGQDYGAVVPGLRPSHLAQDDSDQFDTHRFIFDQLKIADDTHRVCSLTNNPFINAELLQEGYQAALANKFERVVLDCVKVGGDYLHYRQTFQAQGLMRFHYPKAMLDSGINRQGALPTYTSINNTRWAKPSVLTSYDQYKTEVVLNGFVPIWLPKLRNFDLDDQDDWRIGERVFKEFFLTQLTNCET